MCAQKTYAARSPYHRGRLPLLPLLLLVIVVRGNLEAAELAPLRVGMDTRSRPWAFVPGLDYSKEDWLRAPMVSPAQLRRIEGLDIDVMKALSARLHRALVIVPWAWDDIEEGLVSKRFDLILNAWVPTHLTPPTIRASTPYYEWGLLVAVRALDPVIQRYEDLVGRRVGHFRNRAIDRTVAQLRAGSLVPIDDSDKLFEELAAGRLDAVVEDSTYVRWRVATDPRFRAVGRAMNRMGYHVGVLREDRALYEDIEAAIRDFNASEEIGRIRLRWEGPPP